MATDPWPDKRCISGSPESNIIDDLIGVLGDAQDERSLQTVLASHGHLLSSLLPPGNRTWCFDRPRFGSEHIPDFLLCTHTSAGYQWVMVELESPTKAPLTQAGLPSAKLAEALGQVRDWRSWLRTNIAYAQQQLGFRDLNAECPAYVVIGRRVAIQSKDASKYSELSDDKTKVMTYDRLIDSIQHGR